ncbi:sigma-54-dependent transcriptional regulator [Salidesulfovibrio brasiliensis]|uniref:sigma-54-dependent transcriptional regulator n=1 Tax=Salidesulfovibrio brasiliensis TaxID=221711 RepID=UPI0006D23ED4|nr:sigma-54 dependent transcriptional regulator [Salidesulfovibrio brasiliensis]
MAERVLVVDDDHAFRGMLVEALEERGFSVEEAGSAEDGIIRAGRGGLDLVLHDLKLPGMSGLEALPKLKEVAPDTDVIIMTGYGSRDTGIQAIKEGAYDYFSKPFSIKEMEVVIRRAMEKRRMQAELESLRKNLGESGHLDKIIGDSPLMDEVKDRIRRIAELDCDVLVIGETGTGKELVSDTIHALSSRSSGPFVKLNCAAIPESLLESELFGHEKGAFTGATAARPGKFEQAEGGTILLDEIGDMPLHLQPKLLRAVEQKQVERVGGTKPIKFNVRIIAATNQDLEKQVDEGAFRSDLYYRLNVASVNIPPLRDRREDIPRLADHFIQRANVKLGTDIHGVNSDAISKMMEFDWPGNVRQFANAIERAAIFCKDNVIRSSELELAFSRSTDQESGGTGPLPEQSLPLRQALIAFERRLIEGALSRARGVQTEAASILGISPKNLWNKLQKHNIDAASYIR